MPTSTAPAVNTAAITQGMVVEGRWSAAMAVAGTLGERLRLTWARTGKVQAPNITQLTAHSRINRLIRLVFMLTPVIFTPVLHPSGVLRYARPHMLTLIMLVPTTCYVRPCYIRPCYIRHRYVCPCYIRPCCIGPCYIGSYYIGSYYVAHRIFSLGRLRGLLYTPSIPVQGG